MDGNTISMILGFAFALIIFIHRICLLKKKFNIIYTTIYAIIAYITGLTLYPAAYIMYFSATKGKLWFEEPILNYNQYLILAGLILLVCIVWGLMELLYKTKKDLKRKHPKKQIVKKEKNKTERENFLEMVNNFLQKK